MFAPPGIDPQDSDDEDHPPSSQSVSPMKPQFSLKTIFRPHDTAAQKPKKPQPPATTEGETSSTVQKLKKKVRIFAHDEPIESDKVFEIDSPASPKENTDPLLTRLASANTEKSLVAPPSASPGHNVMKAAGRKREQASDEVLQLLRELIAQGRGGDSPLVTPFPCNDPERPSEIEAERAPASVSHRDKHKKPPEELKNLDEDGRAGQPQQQDKQGGSRIAEVEHGLNKSYYESPVRPRARSPTRPQSRSGKATSSDRASPHNSPSSSQPYQHWPVAHPAPVWASYYQHAPPYHPLYTFPVPHPFSVPPPHYPHPGLLSPGQPYYAVPPYSAGYASLSFPPNPHDQHNEPGTRSAPVQGGSPWSPLSNPWQPSDSYPREPYPAQEGHSPYSPRGRENALGLALHADGMRLQDAKEPLTPKSNRNESLRSQQAEIYSSSKDRHDRSRADVPRLEEGRVHPADSLDPPRSADPDTAKQLKKSSRMNATEKKKIADTEGRDRVNGPVSVSRSRGERSSNGKELQGSGPERPDVTGGQSRSTEIVEPKRSEVSTPDDAEERGRQGAVEARETKDRHGPTSQSVEHREAYLATRPRNESEPSGKADAWSGRDRRKDEVQRRDDHTGGRPDSKPRSKEDARHADRRRHEARSQSQHEENSSDPKAKARMRAEAAQMARTREGTVTNPEFSATGQEATSSSMLQGDDRLVSKLTERTELGGHGGKDMQQSEDTSKAYESANVVRGSAELAEMAKRKRRCEERVGMRQEKRDSGSDGLRQERRDHLLQSARGSNNDMAPGGKEEPRRETPTEVPRLSKQNTVEGASRENLRGRSSDHQMETTREQLLRPELREGVHNDSRTDDTSVMRRDEAEEHRMNRRDALSKIQRDNTQGQSKPDISTKQKRHGLMNRGDADTLRRQRENALRKATARETYPSAVETSNFGQPSERNATLASFGTPETVPSSSRSVLKAAQAPQATSALPRESIDLHDLKRRTVEDPAPSWSRCLVSIASCIDLGNLLLSELQSGPGYSSSSDPVQSVLRAVLPRLIPTLVGQKDVLKSMRLVFGEEHAEAFKEFAEHLRVIEAYLTKKHISGGVEREQAEQFDKAVRGSGQSFGVSAVQAILSQVTSLQSLLTPSMLIILREAAEQMINNGFSIKGVVKSLMSIQRELKVARKAKVGSERKAGVDEAGVVMTLLDKIMDVLSQHHDIQSTAELAGSISKRHADSHDSQGVKSQLDPPYIESGRIQQSQRQPKRAYEHDRSHNVASDQSSEEVRELANDLMKRAQSRSLTLATRLKSSDTSDNSDRHASKHRNHHIPHLHLPETTERLLRRGGHPMPSPSDSSTAEALTPRTDSTASSFIPHDLISPISLPSRSHRGRATFEIPNHSVSSAYSDLSSDTEESDREAEELLSHADSGPAPVHGDLHAREEAEQKVKPPEEMVRRAEEVLGVRAEPEKRDRRVRVVRTLEDG